MTAPKFSICRVKFAFVLVAFVCLRLGAGEQVISVTPYTLDSWTLAGASKAMLISNGLISIPARAEFGRKFAGGATVVHLVSRPAFEESPKDWPILEIGPVAIAFMRTQQTAKLVLVLEEATEIEFPWALSPTTSERELDLVVGYDPLTGSGLVSLGGVSRTFDASQSAAPVAVLLTAGAQARWPQSRMEIFLISDEASQRDPLSVEDLKDKKDSAKENLKAAVAKLRDSNALPIPSFGSSASLEPVNSAATLIRMEVFTPSSVRQGRANVIRALLAKKKN